MGVSVGYSFTVVFEPAEEGGYVVTCPALPGVTTEGDTLEEAREMAKDAIRAYLESLRKDGWPVPADPLAQRELPKEQIRMALWWMKKPALSIAWRTLP
jgi:antitoxin HicB